MRSRRGSASVAARSIAAIASLSLTVIMASSSLRKAPVRRWRQARDAVREAVLSDGFDAKRGTFVQAFGVKDLDAAVLREERDRALWQAFAQLSGTW